MPSGPSNKKTSPTSRADCKEKQSARDRGGGGGWERSAGGVPSLSCFLFGSSRGWTRNLPTAVHGGWRLAGLHGSFRPELSLLRARSSSSPPAPSFALVGGGVIAPSECRACVSVVLLPRARPCSPKLPPDGLSRCRGEAQRSPPPWRCGCWLVRFDPATPRLSAAGSGWLVVFIQVMYLHFLVFYSVFMAWKGCIAGFVYFPGHPSLAPFIHN